MAAPARRLHHRRMDSTEEPQLRNKLVFWLLLSVLSVALAEVTVASAPLAFVNPVEAAFLVVFYGSHLLVFAWLAFHRGWPSLTALWFAGVLFGLYEFYITKVLWSPPWGDTISIGHIDVLSLIVLAFFWHPFMAFIFPLAVAEAGGTKSRGVAGQSPTRGAGLVQNRRTWLLVLGTGAAVHGLMTGSPGVAIASMGSALAAVGLAMCWWRRGDRQQRWTLRALLPNDRQGRWIAVLLAAQYVVFIPTWAPERMPSLAGHVVVWILYATFALLLWSALRTSPRTEPRDHPAGPIGRVTIATIASLLAISALASLGPSDLGSVMVWLVATIVGLGMLFGSVRHVLADSRQAHSR
jgi:hypothetical protein